MNSQFRTAMAMSTLAGLGAFDPFGSYPPCREWAKVSDIKIPQHGKPGSVDPEKRAHSKEAKRKKRSRKNKRGF